MTETVQRLLAVGAGGFVGALARYGLGGLVHRAYTGAFPLGTFAVNTLGCLAIGVVMTLVEERQLFGSHARIFLTIGLLGAFTTFSTFGHETLRLLRDGSWGAAALNVAANVMLGLAAVAAGSALARWGGSR